MNLSLNETRRRLREALEAAEPPPDPRGRERGPDGTDPGDDPEARGRLITLLLAGASADAVATVQADAVGYGSHVVLADLNTGERLSHRLMSADAMDLDAGHITTDSPIGAALMGGLPGEVVSFTTPAGPRKVRIEEVRTLLELLDGIGAGAGATS